MNKLALKEIIQKVKFRSFTNLLWKIIDVLGNEFISISLLSRIKSTSINIFKCIKEEFCVERLFLALYQCTKHELSLIKKILLGLYHTCIFYFKD